MKVVIKIFSTPVVIKLARYFRRCGITIEIGLIYCNLLHGINRSKIVTLNTT